MLALAYDATGQGEKAIALIEEHAKKSTDKEATDKKAIDLMGVLAGRFKRRWLLERSKQDADRATQLYSDALGRAEKAKYPDQVYYQAINVAFMALAADQDRKKAKELAQKALDHCAKAEDSVWKSATGS